MILHSRRATVRVPPPPRTPRPIVVGVDDTPAAHLALRWAVEEARLRQVPLRVIQVANSAVTTAYPMTSETFARIPLTTPASFEGHDRAMAYARDRLPHHMLVGFRLPGNATRELLDEARDSTMVVVGTRGRSAVPAAVLGSVSSAVASHATVPVVVVHARQNDDHSGRRRVILGLDGSQYSHDALEFAFEEASVRDAELSIVHCRKPGENTPTAWVDFTSSDGSLNGISDRLADCRTKFPGVRVRAHLISGDPASELINRSRWAELLVVGSRSGGSFAGLLLGSVSQRVLRNAQCPVAVMHRSWS